MSREDYLLIVVLILLVVGFILCPPLIVAILLIHFFWRSIKNQKEEDRINAELRRWRRERRINANIEAKDKRIAKMDEFKRNRL